jgi:phage host-nuclease inhibitor protein Gam
MNITQENSQDFTRLVEYQQAHSRLFNKLTALEVEMNDSAQRAAEAGAASYVRMQEELSKLEEQIKELFARNPSWRGDAKSVKTPFGGVEQRTVTELVVENPSLTVTLIEARGQADRSFDAAKHLHVTKEPNLEALEGLPNDELAKLGVSRVMTERVTVKPAKVNVAKTVKAAKQPKQKAA